MILATMLLATAVAGAAPAQTVPTEIMCTLGKSTLTKVASGITLKQGIATCGPHQASVSVLTIDMTTPYRSVQTTMAPPARPRSAVNTADVGVSFNLTLPTVALSSSNGGQPSSFVAQAAVNASLFTNCCSYQPADWKYPGTFLRGLQIAGGQVNVPVLGNAYIPCPPKNATCFPFEFDATLLIDSAGRAMIRKIDSQQELNAFPDIITAVTGSHMLVSNGRAVAPACPADGCTGEFYKANARTAVGLSGADTMLIIAVDAGGTSTGLQLDELATLLSTTLHADAAINLDGGGSTTMATATADGKVTIVNKPSDREQGCTVPASGNCERYVGAALLVGLLPTAETRQRP